MTDLQDSGETPIRTAFEAGDYERSATLTVERYGPELLGFLVAQLRDVDAADELFQLWCEQLWRTLPGFEWRCNMRTWAYKLARRVVGQHRKREGKQASDTLTQLSQLSNAVERVRTATAQYRRTDVKDRFQQIREQLPEEEQTLLMLRIDRGLDWLELAEVMLGDELAPNEQQLKTEAARLRKRFQHVKERLRKMFEQAGLIET